MGFSTCICIHLPSLIATSAWWTDASPLDPISDEPSNIENSIKPDYVLQVTN